MDKRKSAEAAFHNMARSQGASEFAAHDSIAPNKRFYKVTQTSTDFMRDWLSANCGGKVVLDYCCGNGQNAIHIARDCDAMKCIGIDISDVSIENAKLAAKQSHVANRTEFLVADAEQTNLPANTFDVVICAGVLHHLDVRRAFAEISRILKPGGKVIAIEALNINPIFQLYRRLTPDLRTEWEAEHILGLAELELARTWFPKISINYFHLAVLPAAFVHAYPVLFKPMLAAGNALDKIFMRIPIFNRLAWQMIVEMSKPLDAA